MNNRKLSSLIFTSILVLMVIITGCSKSDSTTSDTSTPASQTTRGVSDTEVVVGTFMPLSGPAAILGDVGKGLDAYIKYVNDNGGVNGRKIKLIMEDDQYQPAQSVAKARKLVEQNQIFAMVAPAGTGNISAVRDYLAQNQVPMVPANSGAPIMSNPPTKYIFVGMPNYDADTGIQVKYVVEKLGLKKIAIGGDSAEAGKAYQKGVLAALAKNNIEPLENVTYTPGTVDLSSHALKLKNSGAEAVILWGQPKLTSSLINEMAKIGYKPQIMLAYPANEYTNFDLCGQNYDGVLATAWLPQLDSDDPKVVLFKENFKKYYPNQNIGTMPELGWFNGQIFVEGLKRAGKNLTVDSLITAMETLNEWDGSLGAPLTYTATRRDGQRSLYVVKADAKNKKFVKVSDWISIDE